MTIPNEFFIMLPDNIDKNNVDDSLVLYADDGFPDGNEIAVSLKRLEDDYLYDQEVASIMECDYNMDNFLEIFDEISSNISILISPLSIRDVINLYEKHGLVFAGYKNQDDF